MSFLGGMAFLGAAFGFSKEEIEWGDDPDEVVVPTVWEHCFRERRTTARGDVDYGEYISGCRFAWRWTPMTEAGRRRQVKVLRLVCNRSVYDLRIAECRK
jgi:hypothetical protein